MNIILYSNEIFNIISNRIFFMSIIYLLFILHCCFGSIQFLDGIVESVSYYIDNFINCESNLKAISKIIILASPT